MHQSYSDAKSFTLSAYISILKKSENAEVQSVVVEEYAGNYHTPLLTAYATKALRGLNVTSI